MAVMAKPAQEHGSVVAISEYGVLIRGAAGAGKSRLAQALIAEATGRGGFGRLVGDDRVVISVTNGRALARPHPAIAGLIEERGAGILAIAYEPAVRLACIVDIIAAGAHATLPRLPDAGSEVAPLAGVPLARLGLRADVTPDEGARRVLAFLHRVIEIGPHFACQSPRDEQNGAPLPDPAAAAEGTARTTDGFTR